MCIALFILVFTGCEDVKKAMESKTTPDVAKLHNEGQACHDTQKCGFGLYCDINGRCVEKGTDVYFEVTYQVTPQPGTERYTLKLPIPVDQARRQEILSLHMDPRPSRREMEGGTPYAIYENMHPHSKSKIKLYGKARLRGYDLKAAQAYGQPLSRRVSHRFKVSNEVINSRHPRIQTQATRLKASTDVETARRIHTFVNRHMTYDLSTMEDRGRTAGQALSTARGVCHDYSLLFMALARANGIPARYVSGITEGQSDAGHGWPEAYLKGLGWVPFDPTWDKGLEVNASTLPPTRLVLSYSSDGSGGTKWTYFGDPIEVDKEIKVQFWTADHERHVRTDCGAERAQLPMSISQNNWSRFQCKSKGDAGDSWQSCLPAKTYQSQRGRGCPGAERCCPEVFQEAAEPEYSRVSRGTLCGSPDATPDHLSRSDWTQYQCQPVHKTFQRSSCLRAREYSSQKGRGCPGEELCCPSSWSGDDA